MSDTPTQPEVAPALLPCPFCGAAPVLQPWDEVVCENDQCRVVAAAAGRTDAEAVAAWNRRDPGWVPVTDRLPEDGVDVLAVDCEGYTGIGSFRRQPYSRWAWRSTGLPAEDVTHWQPLPEPPAPTGKAVKP